MKKDLEIAIRIPAHVLEEIDKVQRALLKTGLFPEAYGGFVVQAVLNEIEDLNKVLSNFSMRSSESHDSPKTKRQ